MTVRVDAQGLRRVPLTVLLTHGCVAARVGRQSSWPQRSRKPLTNVAGARSLPRSQRAGTYTSQVGTSECQSVCLAPHNHRPSHTHTHTHTHTHPRPPGTIGSHTCAAPSVSRTGGHTDVDDWRFESLCGHYRAGPGLGLGTSAETLRALAAAVANQLDPTEAAIVLTPVAGTLVDVDTAARRASGSRSGSRSRSQSGSQSQSGSVSVSVSAKGNKRCFCFATTRQARRFLGIATDAEFDEVCAHDSGRPRAACCVTHTRRHAVTLALPLCASCPTPPTPCLLPESPLHTHTDTRAHTHTTHVNVWALSGATECGVFWLADVGLPPFVRLCVLAHHAVYRDWYWPTRDVYH